MSVLYKDKSIYLQLCFNYEEVLKIKHTLNHIKFQLKVGYIRSQLRSLLKAL